MDYGGVLKRAWEITWRWKVLWILGFLASLGSAGGGGGSSTYNFNGEDMSRWNMTPGREWIPGIAAALIAVCCVAVLIGIVLWVASIMARGGLIAGVQQVEDEGSTAFRPAWRVGRQRFWTLFGIGVLAALPILLLALTLAGVGVVAAVTASQGGFDGSDALLGLGIGTVVLCGGAVCCGMVIVSIVLAQIQIYADRAAILEGLGWIDAFKRGWQVLKENLGPTALFWLIFFVIGMLIAGLVFGAMMVLFLPFAAVLSVGRTAEWVWLPMCCGGLLAALVFALVNSIVQTFTSTTWTLVYRRLTGSAAPVAAAAEIPPAADEPVAVEEPTSFEPQAPVEEPAPEA